MKAEISFLNDTKRAKELSTFTKDLIHFLILLEQIAFKELKLKCINTYAYNLRPYLYPILVTAGYKKADSVLNTRGQNDKKHEIVIHYKMNNSA